MNEEEYLRRLRNALESRRISQLMQTLQADQRNDRHIEEVSNGFDLLHEYVVSEDTQLLEQAYRSFDYVRDVDLKYIKALAYYGKAIAQGYSQTGPGFRNAYANLNHVINMSLWSADYQTFIEELKTDCRHLQEDMKARDAELNPMGSIFRRIFY